MTAARGRQCRACGADEWARRGANKWGCAPCDRKGQHSRRRRLPGTQLYKAAKSRARKRGAPFTVTEVEVQRLRSEAALCPVFGAPLVLGDNVRGPWSPSLDRIDNTRGYEVGNVAIISWRANHLKGDASRTELQQIVEWMLAHELKSLVG